MLRPEHGGPPPGLAGPTGSGEPTETVGGPPTAQTSPANGHRFVRGETVGRYVVLGEIGAGATGVVYAAYDPDLERKVALKLLHASSRRPPAELLREAHALARLNHPNVLTIHDAGTLGGSVFLACELVEGTTLAEWLAAGAHSRREILRCFVAAGRGLAAAHDAELVHRDFKPANVMVAADGRVLVVDFGLARATGSAAAGEEGVVPLEELEGAAERLATGSAAVAHHAAGTPGYMAPEQREGNEPVAASDQYAFCVALTEAFGGRRPEPGGAADAWSRPPLRRLPQRFRRAVVRGLGAAPQQRHASMEALLAALESDPWRARRRITVAITSAALVAAGGLAVQQYAARRQQLCAGEGAAMGEVWGPARRQVLERRLRAGGSPLAATAARATMVAIDRYAAAWRHMRRSACEATHLEGTQSSELLDLRMACLDERQGELAALLTLLEGGATAAEAADGAQALTPLARCADARALLATVPPPPPAVAKKVAVVHRQLATATALEQLGRYPEGVAKAKGLAADAQLLAYWPLTAAVLLRQGILEERASDKTAATTLSRAVDAAVAGGDDRTAAEALVHLVRVHAYLLADHAQARYYGGLAAAALARLGKPPELEAELAEHLGRLAFQEGEIERALALYTRALALRERALGADHPEVGSTLLRLAAVRAEMGELAVAKGLAEQAVALYRAGYGDHHPRVAVGLMQLGDIEYRQGDLAAAEAMQRQALAIRQAALGDDSVPTADAELRLANTLLKAGRDVEARELLERLERLLAAPPGSESPRLADILSSLGTLDLESGDPLRAGERFQRALEIQERVYGRQHPWVANTLYNLGLVAKASANPEVARRHFVAALGIWEKAYGADHYLVGHALTGLGQALIDLGRPTAALQPLERALAIRERAGTEPALLASTRYTLARALVGAGEDRSRATSLAREARDGFRAAADAAGEAEVDKWLAGQGGK